MEIGDSELGFWATFHNVDGGGEREELGFRAGGARAIWTKNNVMFGFDGEFVERSGNFLQWVNKSESSCAASGGSGSQGLEVDVSLKLGLGGELSSSSSSTMAMQRENCDRETGNKRVKVHSFSPFAGGNARSDSDALKMDDLEIRMDLTDDLLYMVFSFLDHIDLCRAAMICRQWRDASSHEDFWRYLNFENRFISAQYFEEMYRRYPNATSVNIYGTPAIHSLGRKAVSALRKYSFTMIDCVIFI